LLLCYILDVYVYNCKKRTSCILMTSQERERSCICVLGVSLLSLYQARNVRGHDCSRSWLDTPNTQIHDLARSWLGTGLVTIPLTHKYLTAHVPGLMYLCVRGIVTKPVPSQERDRSCICVLGVLVLCVRGHVFVC
jgi:hypothetical protein